jgi:hypothetical protein
MLLRVFPWNIRTVLLSVEIIFEVPDGVHLAEAGSNVEVMSLRAIFPLCVINVVPSFHLFFASTRPYQRSSGAVISPVIQGSVALRILR